MSANPLTFRTVCCVRVRMTEQLRHEGQTSPGAPDAAGHDTAGTVLATRQSCTLGDHWRIACRLSHRLREPVQVACGAATGADVRVSCGPSAGTPPGPDRVLVEHLRTTPLTGPQTRASPPTPARSERSPRLMEESTDAGVEPRFIRWPWPTTSASSGANGTICRSTVAAPGRLWHRDGRPFAGRSTHRWTHRLHRPPRRRPSPRHRRHRSQSARSSLWGRPSTVEVQVGPLPDHVRSHRERDDDSA
jgi:hypothetical protein